MKGKYLFNTSRFFIFFYVFKVIGFVAIFDEAEMKEVCFLYDFIDDNIFAIVNIFA